MICAIAFTLFQPNVPYLKLSRYFATKQVG
jgi:hypothetical protein